MAHPAHGRERLGDDAALHPHQLGGAQRGERVFQIVLPFQREVGGVHDLFVFKVQPAVEQVRSLRPLAQGKPAHLAARVLGEGAHVFVVEIQNGVLALPHIAQDFRFEEYVVLHAVMAVEVILGDVCYHGDVRADARERFQLKARNLHDRDVVVPQSVHARREGQTDVAAGNRC